MNLRVAVVTLAFLLSFGPDAAASEPVPLRAGPLTMQFDAERAFLRYVNAGPHEVLRGINAPIRNDIWGTVLPVVSDLLVEDEGDHFSVSFNALCTEPGLDFRWKGTITGSSDGEVVLTFDGTAHSNFKKNRIGFCILHGPSAAGQPWEIEHTDGRKAPGRFPALISPHQPAKDIRAITHEVAPGLHAHIRMEGDIWEMEDQRNWTDASFKTYCTPLAIPYPVEIAEGTSIRQQVTIRLTGDVPTSDGSGDITTLRLLDNPATMPIPRLPRIGLQVSGESDTLTDAEAGRLAPLNIDHVRVDLDPTAPDFSQRLRSAADQAARLETNLHLGLHLSAESSIQPDALMDTLSSIPLAPTVVLCLAASAEQYQQMRSRVHSKYPQTLVAAGYDTNFVDLNRDRPEPGSVDGVTWAINPQIHAFDNASIVESLPIHTTTLETARAFCRESESGTDAVPSMLIGPVTLRSPHMGRDPLPGQLPPDVDLRQPSLFAAAWTVSSLHSLARGAADSVTLYETAGWKGIMDLDRPPRRPGRYPSAPGEVYAVYHVLRALAEFPQAQVKALQSSHPLAVDGLWLQQDNRSRLLVVNFTDTPQHVRLPTADAGTQRQLDSDSLSAANRNPDAWHRRPGAPLTGDRLRLPAFAITVIDYGTN